MTIAVEPVEARIEITPDQYELVRELVYERAGINLGDNRQHLVQARLAKRIRVCHLSGFDDYFDRLKADRTGAEIGHLIDAISTNTTNFFREPEHFAFLTQSILSRAEREGWARTHYTIRIWCAASSSGEEPYTLAITAREASERAGGLTFKILATDISQKVLAEAKTGRYEGRKLKDVPVELRQKYFRRVGPSKESPFEVSEDLRKMVTFAYFNLMESSYPFKYGFDYVFCRNVMIYFDRPTQEAVVRKIAKVLRPGGYLLVGHSESLNGLRHELTYVRPTVYAKPRN